MWFDVEKKKKQHRDEKRLRNLYNQADKNGGEIVEIEKEDGSEDGPSLIQGPGEPSAADLSALTSSSSASKGSNNIANDNAEQQKKEEKNDNADNENNNTSGAYTISPAE